MLKQLVSGIILASVVILMSIPAQAGPRHEPRAHVQRRSHHRPRPHIDRHVRRHVRQHHRRHVQHDRRHHPRHRRHRHHGVFVGIHVGGYAHRPHYPHGHHLHVHSTYCPVVVERHVYHHYVETAPVWEVEHYASHSSTSEAILHIVVAPHHGEVYIDGNYIGEARTFRHGKKLVPVPPGHHTVQLQYGGQAYTRQVTVEPGATAVVKAKRM
ncbi:MAG: PEGA domain-containing protein [Candidatus Tectomicrobia bacterium]|nr:PEGA domain-containing protein [Candidatus Tectomicrobia bacterium]